MCPAGIKTPIVPPKVPSTNRINWCVSQAPMESTTTPSYCTTASVSCFFLSSISFDLRSETARLRLCNLSVITEDEEKTTPRVCLRPVRVGASLADRSPGKSSKLISHHILSPEERKKILENNTNDSATSGQVMYEMVVYVLSPDLSTGLCWRVALQPSQLIIEEIITRASSHDNN